MVRTNTQQKAQTTSVPAPIGGLNAVNSVAEMPPTDALIMDNMFPSPSTVDVRNGYTSWVTGITGWVETLAAYNQASGTNKLFAAANNAIYDVTIAGAVGASVVSGQTSNRYQHTNFMNSAGTQFLYMVNGADSPLVYDGSAWTKVTGVSTYAITGVTTSNLIHVNNFKNRLWFTEKNSFNVWYLGLYSIGGAATQLNLGPLFKLGGYLMGMVNWTVDSSYGLDDYAAFVSSQGEVVVFRGYDPTYAATWSLAGTYRIGKPVGRRFYAKSGADTLAITADGIVSFAKDLLSEGTKPEEAVSYKIVNMINTDVQSYSANFGWQIIVYPIGNKLIINVPSVENSTQYQYVMNLITKAWCTFGYYSSPWSAACFELFGDLLYFGGNGVVYKADVGNDDNGSAINVEVKPAFSYFDQPGRLKDFKLVRPVILSDGTVVPSFNLNLDYANTAPSSATVYSGGGFAWNTTEWNTKTWSNYQTVQKRWLVANGTGYAASLHMKASIKSMNMKLQSIDYVYEYGGVI